MYYVCRFDGEVAIPIVSYSYIYDAMEYAEAHAGDYCSGLEVLNSEGYCLDFATMEFTDSNFTLII